MSGQISYQLALARIDDLQRKTAVVRLASESRRPARSRRVRNRLAWQRQDSGPVAAHRW
jgi:hypothetical protein